MFPTFEEKAAARARYAETVRQESLARQQREAEAAARQEEGYQVSATSLLSKLKQEILIAMAAGKKLCYLRVGTGRANAGFQWEPKEVRVAAIIVERIEAANSEYAAVRGVEKHHYIDYGYGCDRDAYEFYPAVEVRWV